RNVANAGIMVNLQQGASITDNLVQANSLGAGGESGVLLYTNSSTEVARNTMRNVQAGIFLQNGNASTVSVVCNLIESSFYGVRAQAGGVNAPPTPVVMHNAMFTVVRDF